MSNYSEGNTFICKVILTIVNSQLFKSVKQKARNLQNNWTVYIFTYNKLSLIFTFLCSTAHNDTLQPTPMQQTGTVVDTLRFTDQVVSTV
jgi:hypothetical protein